jgi:hypothetical protein
MLYPCDFGFDNPASVYFEHDTFIIKTHGGTPIFVEREAVDTFTKLKERAYSFSKKTIFTEERIIEFCKLVVKENNLKPN